MSETSYFIVFVVLAIPAVVLLGSLSDPAQHGAFKATLISLLFVAVGFILGYRCATGTRKDSS